MGILAENLYSFGRTVMTNGSAATLVVCLFAVLDQYVFRVQRVTRGLSRFLVGRVDRELQLTLTPPWIGALGWLNQLMTVVAAIVVWIAWGWLGLIVFLLYATVGGAIVDRLSPLPTYRHCIRVVKSSLRTPDHQALLAAIQTIEPDLGNERW